MQFLISHLQCCHQYIKVPCCSLDYQAQMVIFNTSIHRPGQQVLVTHATQPYQYNRNHISDTKPMEYITNKLLLDRNSVIFSLVVVKNNETMAYHDEFFAHVLCKV